MDLSHQVGVRRALLAAALFGASTPLAKLLLGRSQVSPVLLAGALYLGSGLGLAMWRWGMRRREKNPREAPLRSADLPWLGGAILAGGVAAPVLLLFGLAAIPAATGALLLNLEGVLTALLAWFVFKENFDRRIAAGMAAIVAGGVLLSWDTHATAFGWSWGALLVTAACLGWALDNNLTRKVSGADPVQVAMWKGLVAGSVNLAMSIVVFHQRVSVAWVALAGVLGFLSYGVSLTLFVLALRDLGAARTGAYFSTAPFLGVAFSLVLLRETPPWLFWPALGLMATGVWLHLSEHHEHEHRHERLEHEHLHVHDEHHQHAHGSDDPVGEPHSHWHRHEPQVHTQAHTPDLHHQHHHSSKRKESG